MGERIIVKVMLDWWRRSLLCNYINPSECIWRKKGEPCKYSRTAGRGQAWSWT